MKTETWAIDSSHSGIHFSVRHLVIARVRGQFTRWTGQVHAPGGDFDKASVDIAIDASSIDTGVADRDAHLRSADFLDTDSHPELTFRTTRVEPLGGGRLRLSGDLTIKGVTRPVVLAVDHHGRARDPWGHERAAFTGKTAIDRKDFGLTWNQALETGGLVVGERIEIDVEIEAVRQAAEQAA